MEFKTRFNPARVQGTFNNSPSETSQEFKDDCDIYKIVGKFSDVYGDVMDPANFVYSDYDVDEDFQFWQDKIVKVKEDFYRLSVDQRAYFGHNVASFHAFCQDKSNFFDGVKLGIFEPNRDDFGNILADEYQKEPGMKPPVSPTPVPESEKI